MVLIFLHQANEVDYDRLVPAQQVYAASRASNTSVIVEAIQEGTGADTPIQLTAGGPNDGNARPREQCYGKLSDAPPIDPSWDYYDCAIPYNLTLEEIGGYQLGTDIDGGISYTAVPSARQRKMGTIINYQSDYSTFSPYGSGVSIPVQYEADTGAAQVSAGGHTFYICAIQPWFFPEEYSFVSSKTPKDMDPTDRDYYRSFENNASVNCSLFDVILKDGTVLNFVVGDLNAARHTNHGLTDRGPSGYWKVSALNYKQYASICSCHAANQVELWGHSGCNSALVSKYNIGEDNPIAYYRMYNKKFQDIM